MNRKITQKVLSMLMVFSLTITSLSFTSYGKTINDSKFTASIYLSDKDIPEIIERTFIEEKGHNSRLYEKEANLESIVFGNKDGTETAYIFGEPVKYIDEEGKVTDKSNKLYSDFESKRFSSDYAYVNKVNDIKTYFPKSLSEKSGIALEAQGKVIEMYPASGIAADVISNKNSNEVYYNEAFGKSTKLRYEPLFGGFKEDIILEENVGNEFKFILKVDGLIPISENGIIHLADKKTGDNFALISPIYVYDSVQGSVFDGYDHFTYDNELLAKTLPDGNIELTVIVDKEFLSNPNTVYPVIVDPTIYATGSGASKTILDTPIYTKAVGTAGANTYGMAGYTTISYGMGRILMKFPGLDSYYSGNTFTEAKLYVREVSGNATSATVGAYMCSYTGTAWTESSAYSSTLWNSLGSSLSTYTFASSGAGSFNILSAVNLWKTNTDTRSKGIILKNNTQESETSNTYQKTFYMSEAAVADTNRPYLSVTYTSSTPTPSPTGSITSVTNQSIQGWAYDQNNTSTALVVHVYINYVDTSKPDHIGSQVGVWAINANLSTPSCPIGGSHGFSFNVASLNLIATQYIVRVFGIGGTNPPLSGCLQKFTVTSPFASDVRGIENNAEYYIRNVGTGRYLTINGSSGNGVICITTNSLTVNSNLARWKVVRDSTGVYRLYSAAYPTKVLDVTGSQVDIWDQSANYDSMQRFFLANPTSWQCQFTIRQSGNSYYVSEVAGNAVKTTASTQGGNSEWVLQKVAKGSVNYFAVITPNIKGTFENLNGILPGVNSTFAYNGSNTYIPSGYSKNLYTNSTLTTAYSPLSTSDIWVYMGHGVEYDPIGNNNPDDFRGKAGVYVQDSAGTITGVITANSNISYTFNGIKLPTLSLNNLGTNALAKEKVVIFLGCKTGQSYNGYNLCQAAVDKGAHCAVGFNRTIYGPEQIGFMKGFFEKSTKYGSPTSSDPHYYNQYGNQTILDCIKWGHANMNSIYGSYFDTIYYVGDVYSTIHNN